MKYFKLAFDLRDYLKEPLPLEKCKEIVKKRIEERDKNFLKIVEKTIFNNSKINFFMIMEEISQNIIERYPKASMYKNRNYHMQVPLTDEVYISINYKNYPNPPKVKLVKYRGGSYKLTTMLSHLREWDVNNPYPIVNVLNEIFLIIDSVVNDIIPFTETCFNGLVEISKQHHPQKIQGLLSVDKGKVSELILPAIKCANPGYGDRINYINMQSFCSIPFDFSYEGTFISRPDGDLKRNEVFNVVMRKRRFTMLLAHPYDKPECIKIYDRNGHELNYKIYSD